MAIAEPAITFYPPEAYKTQTALTELQFKYYKLLASLPIIGSPAMGKQIRSLEKKAKASQGILNSVSFATIEGWVYDATRYI